MKLKTRDIVYIGFIAALCAVATTIRIEIPGGAMVHLGSAALFTSS
ncbi:MAG: ECF transporter S component, partial [Veillonella sp.]